MLRTELFWCLHRLAPGYLFDATQLLWSRVRSLLLLAPYWRASPRPALLQTCVGYDSIMRVHMFAHAQPLLLLTQLTRLNVVFFRAKFNFFWLQL